jgi:hypothetical protein
MSFFATCALKNLAPFTGCYFLLVSNTLTAS